MAKSSAQLFEARLERMRSRLNWVVVHIPFNVAEVWGSRGQLKVRGDINGYVFRTSLFPTGNNGHILLVNKRMQAGAKTGLGKVARFRLEPDTETRDIVVPEELMEELSADRRLVRWFDQLNYSTRKWLVDSVNGAKSHEARARRAAQTAERLLATMEAERELPPAFRLAFAQEPRAWRGWQRMTQAQRRGHLLAVFSYRNPKAQERRLAKAIQAALHAAHPDQRGRKQAE